MGKFDSGVFASTLCRELFVRGVAWPSDCRSPRFFGQVRRIFNASKVLTPHRQELGQGAAGHPAAPFLWTGYQLQCRKALSIFPHMAFTTGELQAGFLIDECLIEPPFALKYCAP